MGPAWDGRDGATLRGDFAEGGVADDLVAFRRVRVLDAVDADLYLRERLIPVHPPCAIKSHRPLDNISHKV